MDRFEAMLSERYASKAISCSSGTSALWLALKSLGIGPGDDVIVPDMTFAATANAVINVGARVVLADVEPLNWCLSRKTVERVLTGKTKAIMAVHLYGTVAPVDDIKVAFGIPVIEDAAEMMEAPSPASLACLSFFGNKVMTTGEGGAVVGGDTDLMRLYRDHGHVGGYVHTVPGMNHRMTNLQAALGCAQLERLDGFMERRREIARRYHDKLYIYKGRGSWLYTILSPLYDRASFIEQLRQKGVEARIGFKPLHTLPPYRSDGAFPTADFLGNRIVSLPTGTHLSDDDVDRVIDAVLNVESPKRMVA